MAEHHPAPAPSADNQSAPAHEPDKIRVGVIVSLGLAVVGLVVLAVILMGGLDRLFAIFKKSTQPPKSIASTPEQLGPVPRFTPNQPALLSDLRASEERALGTYGWTDRKTGIAHIPIARAIDLTAERGELAGKKKANAGKSKSAASKEERK
jgi:hypothetical protein